MALIYQQPFKGKFKIGYRFGAKSTRYKCGYHSGQDYNSKSRGGDGKVYPIAAGFVRYCNHGRAYGNQLEIKHSDGYVSFYAHLNKILVKDGQFVDNNTPIGVEGSTGLNSTGNHLHLEVHRGAYKYPAEIDPVEFIKRRSGEVKVHNIAIKNTNDKKVLLDVIEFEGFNYIKLRDFEKLAPVKIEYNSTENLPIVTNK